MPNPSPDQVMFAHIMGRPDEELDLCTAALVLGEFDYPELNVSYYLSRVSEFAEAAQRRVGTGEHAKLRALNETLFGVLGFRGNFDDYHDPKNSFLNEVIERRLGIPVTLSVLYICVGRQLGMQLDGLSFPGHFLVRYTDQESVFVLDPFHMGISVSTQDMRERAAKALGTDDAELSPRFLRAATTRQVVARVLGNLAAIYKREGDTIRQLAVAERLAILEPDNAKFSVMRDRLRRRAQLLN